MLDETIDFLTRLVAAGSVSSADPAIDTSNAQAATTVAAMLEKAGMQVTEHDIPGRPGKKNITAHAGPDTQAQGLLLAGHTDTVPCNPAAWASDPFTLTERDGKLHGLGACDMKGFFAIIAEALATIDLNQLRQPLRVWATADEECGMAGARHLAQTATPCQVAIVGEPTSLQPVYGHKGALAEQITCHGQSGHSSDPAGGSNAIDAMLAIMTALQADFALQAATHHHADFNPPHPTLSFGLIQGGDAFNRIPDRCRLWLDRRLLPGEQAAAVRLRLHQVASDTVTGMDGSRVEFAPLVDGVAPMRTDPMAPIIQQAEQLSGHKAHTVAYATEAPYYAAAGMEVLVMGAGDIAVAHQPDESIAISEIDSMAEITRQLIKGFCLPS